MTRTPIRKLASPVRARRELADAPPVPDHNWTYQVIGVDVSEQELARSNRYGEHDFGTATGP